MFGFGVGYSWGRLARRWSAQVCETVIASDESEFAPMPGRASHMVMAHLPARAGRSEQLAAHGAGSRSLRAIR